MAALTADRGFVNPRTKTKTARAIRQPPNAGMGRLRRQLSLGAAAASKASEDVSGGEPRGASRPVFWSDRAGGKSLRRGPPLLASEPQCSGAATMRMASHR
jgi:hypothetical protein